MVGQLAAFASGSFDCRRAEVQDLFPHYMWTKRERVCYFVAEVASYMPWSSLSTCLPGDDIVEEINKSQPVCQWPFLLFSLVDEAWALAVLLAHVQRILL